MQSSRETKILNTICVVLMLLAGPIRLIGYQHENFPYNNLICILFSAAAFIWIYQIRKRVIHPEELRYLMAIALLMIFWIVLRTIKYDCLVDDQFLMRFAWYLYYIPQVFCVVLMFLTVLHIGRPYDRPINRKWKLIYIPSVVIVTGILTNDLHQLAFRFPEGLKAWNLADYTYGPFYYVAVLWISVLFLAILIVVFVRCSVPGKREKIWMPLLPLSVAVIYCISYQNPNSIFPVIYTMPEVLCFVFGAFLEGLMLAHLIPTNDSYEDFWNISSIGAGIMEESGEIRYRSLSGMEASPKQIKAAEQEAVFSEDGNVILKSYRIHGGFGYWTRDISEINRLNQKLSDLGNVLDEKNAMLNAENELRAKRSRIEQQNQIYTDIAEQLSPELDKLDKILENLPEEEKAFEKAMKYACILNAYIKRSSNLILLSHQHEYIRSEELQFALMESLEYVRLYGIMTHASFQGESLLPGEWILLAYKAFESILETIISGIRALLVNMNVTKQCLVLCMEMSMSGSDLPPDLMLQETRRVLHGGPDIETNAETNIEINIETDTDTDTIHVSLSFPAGGERK